MCSMKTVKSMLSDLHCFSLINRILHHVAPYVVIHLFNTIYSVCFNVTCVNKKMGQTNIGLLLLSLFTVSCGY